MSQFTCCFCSLFSPYSHKQWNVGARSAYTSVKSMFVIWKVYLSTLDITKLLHELPDCILPMWADYANVWRKHPSCIWRDYTELNLHRPIFEFLWILKWSPHLWHYDSIAYCTKRLTELDSFLSFLKKRVKKGILRKSKSKTSFQNSKSQFEYCSFNLLY